MSALRKEAIQFDYGQELEYNPKKKRIKSNKKNNIVIESLKNSAMIGITFILGIIIIYNYAVITDKKMELNIISQEIEDMNNEIDELNVALESIKNTNKIEELAKTYLGMNYPTRKQTVFVDFAYSDSNITDEANKVTEEDQNLLYGIIQWLEALKLPQL